jgi:uncharacterized protein YndB with AHSA1/START domain/predicted enzyme related to lactoylglutathione lyase
MTNESKRAQVTTPSERELRIERIFDAPRERVWRAMTDPELVAQWWGRGNPLVIERLEVERGGHWRFVEHSAEGSQGFEGRFREVVAPERVVQTFEWDGMPGYVIINTMTLEDLGDGRTKMVTISSFFTAQERDGMLSSGMEQKLNQSYAALDAVLSTGNDTPRAPAPSAKKVAFTVYPITDAARARAFYETTLGLRVGMAGGREGMHWIEYDLPGGGCLALTNTTGAKPNPDAGATLALEVSDLTAFIEQLKAKGVVFKSDVIKGPHCRMAVCLDSEGNPLLLHQLERAAAGC